MSVNQVGLDRPSGRFTNSPQRKILPEKCTVRAALMLQEKLQQKFGEHLSGLLLKVMISDQVQCVPATKEERERLREIIFEMSRIVKINDIYKEKLLLFLQKFPSASLAKICHVSKKVTFSEQLVKEIKVILRSMPKA